MHLEAHCPLPIMELSFDGAMLHQTHCLWLQVLQLSVCRLLGVSEKLL